MSKSRYTVDAPLVAVPAPDGSDRFYYSGDQLPVDVDEALRDRLVDRGLVKLSTASRSSSSTDES